MLAATTRTRLQMTGRSRSRVARYCSSCSLRRRSMKRSIVQPTRPKSRSSLAAGGSTARRYAYSAWRCAWRTSSVLRSRHTELSRSSQWVAPHAPARANGAHHR